MIGSTVVNEPKRLVQFIDIDGKFYSKVSTPLVSITNFYTYLISNKIEPIRTNDKRFSNWDKIWNLMDKEEQEVARKMKKLRDHTINGLVYNPSDEKLDIEKIQAYITKNKKKCHPRSAGLRCDDTIISGTVVNKHHPKANLELVHEWEIFFMAYNQEMKKFGKVMKFWDWAKTRGVKRDGGNYGSLTTG